MSMSTTHHPARFRSLLLILALLLWGLILGAPAKAGNVDLILPGYWTQPNLEFTNGNKTGVGRFNQIHATFTQHDPSNPYSDIIYVRYDPLDPMYPWTEYWLTTNGASSQPALAVDNGLISNNGMAAIAWVYKPCAQNPYGSIYYSYQTQLNCTGCWSTPQQIVFQGAEPAITAVNGTIHLAWTTGDRVQYTSFPRTAPPIFPLMMGEVVDFANCPNTRFHKPSIAFAHPPCGDPALRIASLLASNEQSSVGSCQAASTQMGPKVYERDVNTQVWSTVFQDVVSDPTPGQPDPVAVSLSLNANRLTGDFYLAWSDEQDQAARTRLGHASGPNWDIPQTLDNLRHQVHVAAKSGGAAGHFRLALSDQGWSTSAYSQTGKWSGGLTWTSQPAQIPNSSYYLVANPQALYWRRCAANQLTEIKVYTQATDTNPQIPFSEIATDKTQTGPVNCQLINLGDAVVLNNCFETRVSIAQVVLAGGGAAVLVDLGETASVTRLSSTGAEITTVAGKTIQATWAPGDVVSSWDNGFLVATSRDTVRFSSQGAAFQVEDLGLVGNYNKK